MGLFHRISDILSANLHEMIEKYEHPETMLKQAIREMEATIDGAKRDVAKTMAHETLVARRLSENERQSQQWQTRAESAVVAGDDTMARQALIRRQEHEKLARALADELAAAREANVTLRRQLEAMQAKLSDARRRLGSLVARQKAAAMQVKLETARRDPRWNTDAFATFDRLREKVELAEAEADAWRELSGDSTGCLQTDDSVSKDLEIDTELLRLKNELLGTGGNVTN